jgi:hypothetical protein
MNAASVDIAAMLVAESSLGLTLGDNLFVGREPSTPDNCVTIFDTPGGRPLTFIEPGGDDYYFPTVQIRVRNNDYRTGYDLAHDIMVSIHGRAQQTWGGTFYSVVLAMADPALLDWDENGRVRFVVNFDIQRR